MDQGGTIRNIRTQRSQDILNDLFHTEIVHFERGRWPALSANRIAKADALLSSEYSKKLKQLQAASKDAIDEGAVTAGHVASVEGVWEKYRDAWVAFARVRYPANVAAIRAEITLDRYRFLKTIS